MRSAKSFVLHESEHVLAVLFVECLRVSQERCFLSFPNVSFKMRFFNGFLNAHPFPNWQKMLFTRAASLLAGMAASPSC